MVLDYANERISTIGLLDGRFTSVTHGDFAWTRSVDQIEKIRVADCAASLLKEALDEVDEYGLTRPTLTNIEIAKTALKSFIGNRSYCTGSVAVSVRGDAGIDVVFHRPMAEQRLTLHVEPDGRLIASIASRKRCVSWELR